MRKSTVMKKCQDSQCTSPDKTLSDFHRNRTKKDGHNGICKECQARRNLDRGYVQ